MIEVAQFALVFIAVIAGFALGRWQRRGARLEHTRAPVHHFQDALFDASDAATEAFIDGVPLDETTVEIYFALGKSLRQQGAISAALKIHEHTLTHADLPNEQRHSAAMALAQDYRRSGLLDRAERHLKAYVKDTSLSIPERRDALEELLKVFEELYDWLGAIDVADRLTESKFSDEPDFWRARQAHYACELAVVARGQGDNEGCASWLARALKYDPSSARSSLLRAEVDMDAGKYPAALGHLRTASRQKPALTVATLPLTWACFDALGDRDGYAEALKMLYELQPSPQLTAALYRHLASQGRSGEALPFIKQSAWPKGIQAGLLNTVSALETEPSLFSALHPVLSSLMDVDWGYECQHCGFRAETLFWRCPSCYRWDTALPIP